jgi:osmotically-inducible protein OsmY
MHVEGGAFTERGARSGRRGGSYDYGRGTEYSGIESFTWDVPGPHSGRGPKGYRRPDDRIHEEICDRLEAHGEVDASDVEVKVENGEVTLSGTVRDRHTKRTAERVVDSVRGVVDVHNQLRLAREGDGR